MARLFGVRLYGLVCVLLVALGGVLAARMAYVTRYNVHPDEFIHVDAFCYFTSHAWLPPLDLNGLNYGPEGESRVYGPEVVYWVYGRSANILRPLRDRLAGLSAPAQPLGASAEVAPRSYLPFTVGSDPLGAEQAVCLKRFLIYRLLNVALFIFTLGIVFIVGAWHAWAAAIGMALLCLPQVVYLYAYANSDAWALSVAIFLIVFALAEPQPLGSWSKAVLLGALTGTVLVSKSSVWAALPLAYALIAFRLVQGRRNAGRPSPKALAWHCAAVLATALLFIAPLRIVYPLSQGGHFQARLAQIREARADPGFKPSDSYIPGRMLRSKGVGLDQIVFNWQWLQDSARAFYGNFGYLTYPAPDWAYWIALSLAILNALLTLAVLRRHWAALPATLRLAFAMAPLVVALCVAASMFNSWTHDFQPQGRYLFVAAVPIALWMWGSLPWDGPRARAARLGTAAVLLAQCAYVFWRLVLQNPGLRL
ncbi:MAG: DUF2142 domain-containing protein [Anaerolineales bacterium]